MISFYSFVPTKNSASTLLTPTTHTVIATLNLNKPFCNYDRNKSLRIHPNQRQREIRHPNINLTLVKLTLLNNIYRYK